jgi:hypothetical protein
MHSGVTEREHPFSEETSAQNDAGTDVAIAVLFIVALVGAALWLIVFTRPYSLTKLYAYVHLDLERLQIHKLHVSWVLLLTLFTQGAIYWLGYQATRRARGRAAWAAVILAAGLSWAVLLPMYPLGSTDIFDYILHGRMVGLYHLNPFVQTARQVPGDVFSQYVGWPDAPSAYGPLWEVLAGRVAWLANGGGLIHPGIPGDIIRNVIAFKLVGIVFLAASAAVVGLILHQRSPDWALSGVFLLAANPIVVYETAGNGHNDIVMVFFVLLAVLAILYHRYTLGVLALTAGTLIKFIPILMIPAAALIALRDLPSHRARARFLLVSAVAGLALIVVCYLPFWDGLRVLSIGRREQLFTSSLPTIIAFLLAPRLGLPVAMSRISLLAAGLTVLFATWEGSRAWHDRSWTSFVRSAFDISILYLLGTALWLWPWYSVWPLALAVLLAGTRPLPAGKPTWLPGNGALLLAECAAFGLSLRPYLYSYLVLTNPAASAAWQELRLGPGVLVLPWLALLYLVISALVRERQPAAGEVRVTKQDQG